MWRVIPTCHYATALLLVCAPVLQAGEIRDSITATGAEVAAAKQLLEAAQKGGLFENEDTVKILQAEVEQAEELTGSVAPSAYANQHALAKAMLAGTQALTGDINAATRGAARPRALPRGPLAEVQSAMGSQLSETGDILRRARMAGKFNSLGEISAARESLAHAAVLMEGVTKYRNRNDEEKARALLAAANALIANVRGSAGASSGQAARSLQTSGAAQSPKSPGPRVVSRPGSSGLQLSDRFPEFALE